MAVFNPDSYQDENEGQDFFAPEGRYELYFSELSVGKGWKEVFRWKGRLYGWAPEGKVFFPHLLDLQPRQRQAKKGTCLDG